MQPHHYESITCVIVLKWIVAHRTLVSMTWSVQGEVAKASAHILTQTFVYKD